MSKRCNILGIAGSLRRDSYNRSILRAAERLAPAGSSVEVFELDGIPPFNEDDEEPAPARIKEFRRRIRAADALLFATPEYNYSIPGVLKNAIDWASRPYGENAWAGKPAAIMGASIGTLGTARAQYHLRQVFVALDVHVINQPEVMVANAAEKFDAAGVLTDGATRTQIRELLECLVGWTERLARSLELPANASGELLLPHARASHAPLHG